MRFVFGTLALIVMLLLSGCSMGIEVNERAFVQLMGIERDDDIYFVSMQVYNSESGTPEPDVSKANTITAKCSGETVHSAISDAELTLGKKIFLGHIKMLIVGNGVKNPSDELSLFLDGSISPSCPVAFSADPAAIIETLPEEGSFSAEQILAIADSYASQGKTIFTSVAELAENTGILDVAAALPVITAEEKSVKFEGLTLAEKNGMHGNLDENETLGTKFLLNMIEAGDKITVPVEVNGNHASVFITKSCTKLDAKLSGELTVNAEIKLKMSVAENPYEIKPALIEQAVRQQISESCMAAYSAAVHENLCDIFGIKKLVRRHCPEKYNDYCNSESSYLAKSTLNLKVRSIS